MDTTRRFQRAAFILSLASLTVLAVPITTEGKGHRATRPTSSKASQPSPRTRTAVRPAQPVKAQATHRATIRRNPLLQPHTAHQKPVLVRRRAPSRYPFLLGQPRPRVLDLWRIHVIDGDTFSYGADRIRIRGIDTPEVSETGGFEASQRLALLLQEGPVTIIPEGQDKYGRLLADVYVNDRNVAEVLRAEGYAKSR